MLTVIFTLVSKRGYGWCI